ncbi:MAG: hypothetical protein AAFO84_10770 [Cyanobacteria bacterium J06598_1]
MIVLTAEEITQFNACLADYSQALSALQEIEDCDGDLEDAAISLALRSGQEPGADGEWLAGFSKRYRHIACQPRFRQPLEAFDPSMLVAHLTEKTDCPALLAAPVAIYITKFDVSTFCYTFDNSRVS